MILFVSVALLPLRPARRARPQLDVPCDRVRRVSGHVATSHSQSVQRREQCPEGAGALRTSLRLSATLLLAGQLVYILVTQLHADGDANNHRAVFAEYAGSGIWKGVHVGQFAGMAILLAGLMALFFAVDVRDETARWTGRFGASSAVVALALYGVLQAADGVANKEVDDAW